MQIHRFISRKLHKKFRGNDFDLRKEGRDGKVEEDRGQEDLNYALHFIASYKSLISTYIKEIEKFKSLSNENSDQY